MTEAPFNWQLGRMLPALAGTWRLERRISGGASMEGVAAFTAQPQGRLLYSEKVRVNLPDGQQLDGERRYLFEERATGLGVFFDVEAQRLFHIVELSVHADGLRGGATHYCGADVYDSVYDFGVGGGFLIRHVVTGPRKDYRIETLYRRCASVAGDHFADIVDDIDVAAKLRGLAAHEKARAAGKE
jgi:hypothetical protein